jgi:hypothetical protein
MCLEVVLLLQSLSQDPVVVDFAVDGQGNAAIIVDEGLRSGVWCEFSTQILSGKLGISTNRHRRYTNAHERGLGIN